MTKQSEGKQPFIPPDWLDREEEVLAPYAMRTRQSQGRQYQEPVHPYRTLYQRDRDRIVHSTAFRRLMHKTQVLVTQTNDHHRTRLTHTMEVAQISRTIARYLGLNEDLTESIALSHDLGHPPFGHAGEESLNNCMKKYGGFEHNHHGFRIVSRLEYRYANFPGLNLSWEVLQAMAQHSRRPNVPDLEPFRHAGNPLLEAQVADAADSLAYDAHDLDDALGVGLILPADLEEIRFWRLTLERTSKRFGKLEKEQFQPTMIRALIEWQVTDLLQTTEKRIRDQGIDSVEAVRQNQGLLVGFGKEVQTMKAELEAFLRERVYGHHRVQRMAAKGQRIVETLFHEFTRAPQLLPERYSRRVEAEGIERVVCDYVAGMTDRFAMDEYLRLFQPYIPV